MLCPLRRLKPTVIEPPVWIDIGSGEIETSPWCELPSFVSISAVFCWPDCTPPSGCFRPMSLTEGPRSPEGGACNLGWCVSSTIHDLFPLVKFQTSMLSCITYHHHRSPHRSLLARPKHPCWAPYALRHWDLETSTGRADAP